MYETMYSSDGVGLAAPQIGRNDRIVVIDASPLAEAFPSLRVLSSPLSTLASKCSTARKKLAAKAA